jgi:ADP-heptose:LPS heptosyltransferase
MNSRTITPFHNGLGNFVQLTPALQAMASMDPSGKIDICADSLWQDYRKREMFDLWERLPFIGRVVGSDGLVNVQDQYDTWFYTGWSYINDETMEIFYKHKKFSIPDWNFTLEHETEYYLKFARDFYGYSGLSPKQVIIPADTPVIDKQGKRVITLCNGGFGALKFFKDWPYFPELVKEIKAFIPNILTVKIGHAEELSDTPTDIDYVNKLTLSQTARVIQQSDVIVCTDTGNMHIADALETPLIVIWGGSSLIKNKPVQAPNKIIHLDLPCQVLSGSIWNCKYQGCFEKKCMDNVTVGGVMYAIRSFLNGNA